MNNEHGDFQTPLWFVEKIAELHPFRYTNMIEPTCGHGAFLKTFHAEHKLGIEIQPEHAAAAKQFADHIVETDVFQYDFASYRFPKAGPMLIAGNPPWMTVAEFTKFTSEKIADKSDYRTEVGFAAKTGAVNVDITEHIVMKLIEETSCWNPTFLLLMKTHTARNLLYRCNERNIALRHASIRKFNAKEVFGVSVDACLFTFVTSKCNFQMGPVTCDVYRRWDDKQPTTTLGFCEGQLVTDIDLHVEHEWAHHKSFHEWRQGVKHDAASILELSNTDGVWHNKLGGTVNVETEHLFPLAKSSDVHHGRPATRRLVVPQRTLKQDMSLEQESPLLWSYLQSNIEHFRKRKSAIYDNHPFAIFGVGDYTFAPWKVAVSGLHADANFRVYGPVDGKPVVFDDATYFVAFDTEKQANSFCDQMNGDTAQAMLSTLQYRKAKRPVTKRLLQQVNTEHLSK